MSDLLSELYKLEKISRMEMIRANADKIIGVAHLENRLIMDECRRIRSFILRHTERESTLAAGAKDECVFNRTLVAERTKDLETLKLLSKDPLVWVCVAVAENKNINGDIIDQLFSLKDITVQIAIFKNPKLVLYQDILKKHIELGISNLFIYEILKLNYLSNEILETLFKKEDSPELIKRIIFHRSAPEKIREPFRFLYPEFPGNYDEDPNELEKIVLRMAKQSFLIMQN